MNNIGKMKILYTENLHEFVFIEKCKLSSSRARMPKKGFYRRKQMKNYSEKKQDGGFVSGKSISSINTEISCKAIACNLELLN